MSRERIRNILGFWYHQALFAPLDPLRRSGERLKIKTLPQAPQAGGKAGSSSGPYRLYGGLAPLAALQAAAEAEDGKESFSARDEGCCCLYTLALDKRGRYMPGSFRLALYPWAIGLLCEAEDEEDLPFPDPGDCDDLSAELDEELSLSDPRFTESMIEALNRSLEQLLLGDGRDIFDKSWFALEEDENAAKDPKADDLLLKELRKAAEEISPRDDLAAFLQGPELSGKKEAKALYDPEVWKAYFKPDAYPPAQWPASEHPALSQQHLINVIYAEDKKGGIRYFHAPFTAERESVIANTLAGEAYKRASFLARLSKPADAFTMRRFRYPPNNFSGNYYVPYFQLAALDLSCTAEDAAALKHLAAALGDPTFINRSHSHSDSFDLKRHKELYFTETAKSFLHGTPWGLAAVYIEDEEDLLRLVRSLLEVLDPKASLWENYAGGTDRLLSWEEAKQRFVRQREKVREKTFSLQKIYRQSEEVLTLENERDQLAERLETLKEQVTADEAYAAELKEQSDVRREHLEGRKADVEAYEDEMRGFWKIVYLLFKIGPYARGLDAIRRKVKESAVLLHENQAALEEQERRLRDSKVKYKLMARQLELKEQQIEEKRPATELMRAALGKNYADHEFYLQLGSAGSQSACPWTDHELAAQRERMFKASLDLIKSFAVHANEIRQNLKRLELMLEGAFHPEDEAEALSVLLHTLHMVIPLCLMPQPLLRRLERYGSKGASGTLLCLDPERSRPEDLTGPILRAGKSFFFGDSLLLPRQYKTAEKLDRALREGFGLPAIYGLRRYDTAACLLGAEEEIYQIGKLQLPFPLRFNTVQSRMLYELDNTLCLDGLWLGTAQEERDYPDDFLEESAWLDIGGSCEENSRFIYMQADVLSDMICDYAEAHNKLPDAGIACYYPTVYSGFKQYVNDNWLKEDGFLAGLFSEETIKSWFESHCFLLSSDELVLRDEVLFLSGADDETDEAYLDLFFRDRKGLHTLLNCARRKIMILADAGVWASRPPADRLYAALNREENPGEIQKKTLVFIRSGKSEQDEEKRLVGKSDSKLSEEGRKGLSLLAADGRYPETDRYYTSGLVRARESLSVLFPEAENKLEKTAFNEADLGPLEAAEREDPETREMIRAWYEGKALDPAIESRKALLERANDAVKELLDELERLSLTGASIITHQLLMKVYYDSLANKPLNDTLYFCHGGGFKAEYRRIGRKWKPAKLELLPDSLSENESECREKMRRRREAAERKAAEKNGGEEAAEETRAERTETAEEKEAASENADSESQE